MAKDVRRALMIAKAKGGARDKGATASMEKAGIPGVRYYDGYSRSKGDGSRNYVVFPTAKEILEITRKRASGGEVDDDAPKPVSISLKRPEQPAVTSFMNEYEGDTHPHPFVPGSRFLNTQTGGDPGGDFAMLDLRKAPYEKKPTVYLSSIMALNPGKGQGKQGLKYVTDLADKHGVHLTGYAKQFGNHQGPTLSTAKLKQWYARNGFDVSKAGNMLRPPGGAPAKVAKKAKGGAVAQHHLHYTAQAMRERHAHGGAVESKDVKRALMIAKGTATPIRAYHGTPYDFDRFDFNKIGAGEGAQAYGHGLYFAGHEPVAKGYRDKLAKDWFATPDGKFWTPDSLEHLNVRVRARNHAPYLDRAIEKARDILSDKYSSEEMQAKAKRDFDKLIELQKQGGVSPVTGRMYEVAIHADPEKFLDWDRPLRDQRHILEMAAESVGGERAARQAWKDWDALNDHLSGIDYDEEHSLWKRYNQLSAPGPDRARIKIGGLYGALDKEAATPEKYPANRQLTQKGEDLYRAVAQRGKTNALGSEALETRGVPGVRYFDALSRGAGEGTSNYVVFPTPEDILEITRKYARGGAATKDIRRALMIARDQRNLLRRIANIYPGPGGGMDPSPGGGGYSGPGGGKYIGPSHYADGGGVDFKQDNPAVSRGNTEWLASKQRTAYSDPALLRGAITGYFKDVVHIPVDMLDGVPGANKENPVPGTYKYDELMKDVKKEGWKPTPILVGVNHKGKAHILEGNHRVAVARALGQTHIPGDIRWWNGGEEVEGDWHPKNVVPRLQPHKRATGGSVPPFKLHSGAAKIIGAKGQAKATPQQYAAMPGIKPDELKYSSFDALGSKALPREEVIKHLEDNAVPLHETVLGNEPPRGRENEDGWSTTKFSGHQFPGGKNYREVLMRLPRNVPSRAEAEADARERFAAAGPWEALRPEHREMYTERARRAMTTAADQFKSNHWDEPNVLAHVRMSDRVGPNGEKILHLEEAQSDWGQQGRDQGFARDPEDLKQAAKARDDYVAGLPARVRAEIDRRIEKARGEGKEPDVETAKQVVEELTQDPFGAARFLGETDKHNEMRNAAMPSRDLKPQTPRGPYVDNTQKWTDLALKRVLHEAAHGGYDRIVVTPGDEQNKRYDLSSQVKNIQYYPDIGYLHATTHDNQGVEHEDVKPEDLSKHIGKEAADRILKQGMQRYEGRGKLGGEFYHELEGEGLKVGGEGMRGYYDNILPKRLQALAQQHDPQAKVQLGGYTVESKDYAPATGYTDNNKQLHSLDVTPQMRDSIKANGFNSFKRGGEVDDDPIKDWQWRPTEDVRNELQLDEIPSHVHKFGEFMDETARRAATQGLTPRDLIKAYAITRSSIGRGALPVSTVRRPKNPEYGFDALPKGLQGTLRPEGAMGHWLHTKMGQRYLDEAEAGRVDEEAVRDAIKSMGAFGLPDTAEGKALRWAPKNLPGQEGRVSELIARAHRGQSSPEEWRGEMRVPGIAESKAGFFASMLGRGDQPTLDARQIILNTGQSTKKAAPYLSPKGAKEAAVNRLAGRQTELGLKHDKSMSPFYQHLTHHAIWDKTGGEETTHDDLMQALRGAKDGGRQGYAKGGGDKPLSLIEGHPVVQGLSMALPPEAELQQLLRKAGIVRPYNQPTQANVERALEIAKTYAMPLGVGSKDDPSAYYGVKQPTAARDVTTKAGATAGFSLKPEKAMSWKEFGAIGKGGHVVNLSGDRTRFGTLHEINGQPLNWPVKVYAGPDYIREPVKGRAWASAPGVISGLNRTVTDLSKKGPVFGMYSPYGATGGDFAHHMFDAVMAQVNPDQISKSAKKKFDAAMRDASFIMGQTDKDKSKRERVKPRMEDWPGVDDPKAASEFARKNLTGDHRKAILEYLDKKSWTDEGFPHVGMTRVAVTDPKLLKVPQNVIGGNVALLTPSDTPLSSKHPSYSAGQPGEYVGTLPFAPRHYALPVTTGHFVKTPSAGKGVYVDPYSLNDRARGGYRTLFERNYVPEPVSNQMAEGAEEGIRKMPLYGLKRGGSVSRALDIARKINGR